MSESPTTERREHVPADELERTINNRKAMAEAIGAVTAAELALARFEDEQNRRALGRRLEQAHAHLRRLRDQLTHQR